MKKILSLLSLLMLSIVGMNAQTIIYSWESPEGTPIETGGTIAYVNGDGDRLNYQNSGYYTICLNGKKNNVNDETASANAGKMVISLDNELAAGDEIAITAYITKNESKNSSAYIIFETGTAVESDAFGDAANIDQTFNGSPQTKIVTVPDEAAGSKTITMTRGQTGTNLFITKLVITRAGSTEVVYTVAGNNTAIFGTEWDAANAANDMVKGEDGIYTKIYEGVELTNGYKVEYKVVENHSWDVSYGNNGSNADYTVWEGDGKYDVTFTFNPETKAVACDMTKVADVFDFADPNFRTPVGEAMTDVAGYIYNETFAAGEVTLQVTAGSAPSRIYVDNNRGQNLVTYKEYTTLTFKVPEGKAIKKIEFTAAGNSNINNFTASSGAIDGMTWTGNAEGVRFLQGGTSYLANAIVTLADKDDATAALPAIEYAECANIAAFNALEAGTYAKITLTDAEIIGKSADGYSTVWVQDATGGAWIQYTSLNDRLQEGTKVNGTVYTVKREASGNPQLKEAVDTPQSEFASEAISAYTMVEGTIGEVNVAANLNKVVKISGATLTISSATAGKLAQGDVTINVNNGNATANQQLHKIAAWESGTTLENVTVVAILVASSATANQLLPISIEETPVEINSMAIVGDFLGLATEENPDANWDPANGWAMTQSTENPAIWTLTKRFVAEAKTYYYKATANGNWDDYVLPSGDNANYNFDTADLGAGKYILTFTANTEEHTVNLNAEKVVPVVFPEGATVFDFEAAAAAGENPANKNGSAANGQTFYGWEKADKTDSKRQDYKGYEWAEGSVLPEVCQVWRRSDRINGNVKDGGLYCPSDKEMAIDGLNVGDKVYIVYDAENATNKDIIWAIGDGTSEGGPGTVRATATIGGVEAVTGETTIASGAEIVINSVTPAENGSGYIVFQVKKGMVINQIAIVSMNAEWAEAIAAAQALAEEDGVAVGKLLAAIDEAKGISEPTDEQKAALQAAVDQYKLDNADQEKDETAKVATNGWKKFDGSDAGVCSTQYAPAITTYDGRTANMAECYEGNGNRTGTIIYQDITGLTNGKYKVGFYGNAFSTSQRDGFECTMEDGATDVAYVFANEEKEYITARIATSTTENNFRTFDVEVTNGTIKLGMGKDTEKSTNWHTIQIYQLTWFTTAKEVYAADQAELAALVTEAKALVADENKTEGKDALNAAIATAEEATTEMVKWYNVPEIEEIIANLKAAIATFKKANWYIDFPAGEYYIVHAQEGLMMAAGHNYGTRGIINEIGLDLTLTPYSESRTVTIDSRVSNGGNSHFLGTNLYMDSSEWGWALEYQGFGFYILEPNDGKYINIDSDFNLVLSDTPCEWVIVSKDGVMAQLLYEMSEATETNPVDATRLIKANNFNRNDLRNDEAWIVSEDCTNKNLSGGNETNNCAESYHSTFTIMQIISGAPAGKYELTAQGFYRQDNYEGETPAAPVFFANEVNGDVPVKTGSENGMSDASASFTSGLYTIDPIPFEVGEDGMMYIGITASTNTQWVIWDNFRLKYFGKSVTDGITTTDTVAEKSVTNAVYNLNGQRVVKAQKGLYIINGKKVVIK